MSQTTRRKDASQEYIVSLLATLPDGTHIIEHPDGRLERRRSETDWAHVRAMSDREIEEAVRGEPDAVPFTFDWSKAEVIVPAKKLAISIRLDPDVVEFFKQEGPGYQRRMNAVLRSYMDQKREAKKRA